MADFKTAYTRFIQPFEGGYVNHPNDKGGETYAGIARRKFPQWDGWRAIDHYKDAQASVGKEIARNTIFPELQEKVDSWYEARWNAYRLSEIKNQNLASLLYDYIIHSGSTKAITAIQKIVGTHADGIIGDNTINAINANNPQKVFTRLLDERAKFLKYLIVNDPTQKVFENGWNNRIATFRKLVPSSNGSSPVIAGGLIAAIGIIILINSTT